MAETRTFTSLTANLSIIACLFLLNINFDVAAIHIPQLHFADPTVVETNVQGFQEIA